jgi:filamentous hemagglutinin
MGVAQIDIPGVQSTMAASSRIPTPTAAQQSLGFVGEVPEAFPSSVVPTSTGYPLNRVVDSEAKILNNVAAQLGENTSVTGTINLLTERAPCASCSNVIQQFQAKYPNITVNVMDNGGVIAPTKKVP